MWLQLPGVGGKWAHGDQGSCGWGGSQKEVRSPLSDIPGLRSSAAPQPSGGLLHGNRSGTGNVLDHGHLHRGGRAFCGSRGSVGMGGHLGMGNSMPSGHPGGNGCRIPWHLGIRWLGGQVGCRWQMAPGRLVRGSWLRFHDGNICSVVAIDRHLRVLVIRHTGHQLVPSACEDSGPQDSPMRSDSHRSRRTQGASPQQT